VPHLSSTAHLYTSTYVHTPVNADVSVYADLSGQCLAVTIPDRDVLPNADAVPDATAVWASCPSNGNRDSASIADNYTDGDGDCL